jgi:uncharacterized membrane protein YgcG
MRSKSWKALALLLLVLPAPVSAQSRSLYWRSLDVRARLDAEGRLQVVERHHMVFTGDWNGGERGFRLGLEHRLELNGIEREDLETHSRIPLTLNRELTRVDDYAWADSKKLRWRSRLESDPPFQDTDRVYVLDYTLENVLVPAEEGFLLDHDFAFPDRPGPILSFSLDLTLDPSWSPKEEIAERILREKLQPGESLVITVPLVYRGEGSPSGVRIGPAAPLRSGLVILFVGAGLAVAFLFYRAEQALGRFAPLAPLSSIDRTWLEANVFSMLPEEVGAAWDDRTAAPEVAAVLARMVSEEKLRTEVFRKRGILRSQENLHMELLVDRKSLSGYERTLVNALFVSGDSTDTVKIRKHYESKGFDPAAQIAHLLKQRVARLLGDSRAPRRISGKPTRWLLASSLLVFALSAYFDPAGLWFLLAPAGAATLIYGLGFIAAALYRKRIDRLLAFSITFLVPALALAGLTVSIVRANPHRNGLLALLSLALFVLALLVSLFNAAKFREGSLALDLRKKLASARRYFAYELSKPDPRLEDRWFPYLLAFELGPDVDRWFRAYGPADSTSSSIPSSSDHGSSSSGRGGGSSSRPWTGGGGGFGGAGATGSWAAAVGTVASGVAAPSESGSGGSSSSGGGGGGGSSGGGSGGGW